MENAEVEREHGVYLRNVGFTLERRKHWTSGAVDLEDSAVDSDGVLEGEGFDDVCVGFGDGGG